MNTTPPIRIWIAQRELLVGIGIDPNCFSDVSVPGIPDGYKNLMLTADQVRTLIAELQDRLIQIE